MLDWVGTGDPMLVGAECFDAIAAVIELKSEMRVLDFGCGIGRNSIYMADFLGTGKLVGVDIVPEMVEFCQKEIVPLFPNTSFLLSSTDNPLYRKYVTKSEINSQDLNLWTDQQRERFDLVYAFSVFAHLDPEMAQSTLDLFACLLPPGGLAYFTAFLDCEDNPPNRKLRSAEQFRDCEPEPMLWVVHSLDSILAMSHRSGFSPRKVAYGLWRGCPRTMTKGDQYQDAILLIKQVPLPEDFDPERYLSLHQDLIAAGVDGTIHYKTHGYFERRRYR